MRISVKMFIFTYLIMMVILVTGGYALINYLYNEDMKDAVESTQNDNESIYTYVAAFGSLSSSAQKNYADYTLSGLLKRYNSMDQSRSVMVLRTFDEWQKETGLYDISDFEQGKSITVKVKKQDKEYIMTTSRFGSRYIVNYTNISGIVEKRKDNIDFFGSIIIGASVFIAVLLLAFTSIMTKPITKLTDMAEKVSDGDYSVRVDTDYKKMKSYEVSKLGETLNHLAENTERHIACLENETRKKEDFVGNFTHELKTPLTSIIGYSDMLRTYDLDAEKRREYSNFIYSEAKRLEKLSYNLLELIVMGNTDFELTTVPIERIFDRIREMAVFTGKKYGVTVKVSNESALVEVEMSMLETAILNLVDNACKASEAGNVVEVVGTVDENCYSIQVKDSGRGIPADEIDKITEPFYMVDKSRARKQGGAGLGLALCKKIADGNNAALKIESVENVGTTVTLELKYAKNNDFKGDGLYGEEN